VDIVRRSEVSDSKAYGFIALGAVLAGIGVLVAGIGAAMLGFAAFNTVPDEATSRGGSLVEFQVVQLGEFRRDQFLLDRRSGRIWHSVCSGEVSGPDCKGMLIWDEMYVANLSEVLSPVSQAYRTHLVEQIQATDTSSSAQ
jgi:hypothetical protein